MRTATPYRIPEEDPQPSDVKRFAQSISSCFFEPETMRFFSSELEQPVYSDGHGGAFFVTSEQLTTEVKKEIVRKILVPLDETVDSLARTKSYRGAEGMNRDDPRQWKVRHASFEKQQIRTVNDKFLYVCLADADAAAKLAAEAARDA